MSQAGQPYDLSYTQNRELSWLKFNKRVLEEAEDQTVPLIERFRFLSIFTKNLDEFFMVRVGSLFDLSILAPGTRDNKSGQTPAQQLEMIYDAVRLLIQQRDAVYTQLTGELEKNGLRDIAYEKLKGKEKEYVQAYYKEQVQPLLSPQIIDRNHPFPHLKNKGLYIAALLQDKQGKKKSFLGIVGVPETVARILFLPGKTGEFVRIENILLAHVKKIFKIYPIQERAVIAVTRNADISYDDDQFDEAETDFRSQMVKLLKKRERLAPVRLEMQGESPQLLRLLRQMLRLNENQSYICSCPLTLEYVDLLKDCAPSLYDPPHSPVYPDYLNRQRPVWEQAQQRDILLFYPYHSMRPFLDLLKEAAADTKVLSIKITIYRLARNSSIVKHLCAAAENGKDVTVLVELRARFDEKNNIEWARELEEAGCQVIYGIEGYKCHAKICLITRKEKNGLSYITQIGTGNYNEKTAGIYTDFSLITADRSLAQDAVDFFQNMLIGNLHGHYQKLLVAPFALKRSLLQMIEDEITRGPKGHILIKANSITERQIIDKLAEASQAGVKVELIIRGICCLVPGIPGKTDNITVTSIVGRFLEHSRIYCFGDGDQRKIYLSSADLMTRNQTRRVEIACPVESPELKEWFSGYLDILLADNTKARRLAPSGDFCHIDPAGAPPFSSQEYWLKHPPHLTPTVLSKHAAFSRWLSRLWKD